MGKLSFLNPLELRSLENPAYPLSGANLVAMMDGELRSDAGTNVNTTNALGLATAWACVDHIGSTVGTLPLQTFAEDETGDKRQAVDNPVYGLLYSGPNPEMTSATWRKQMMAHVLTAGNHYAEIERNGRAEPTGLWPLLPEKTKPFRTAAGQFLYLTTDTPNGTQREIRPENMLHVFGLTLNGREGVSVITYAKQVFGSALAAQKFSAKFYANGARMSGILGVPPNITPEQRKELADRFTASHTGDNAHKIAVIPGDVKYQSISISPDDAQFIETSKLDDLRIARLFRVPGVLVGVDDKTQAYSSVEAMLLAYEKHCIRPWLVVIEQEIHRKLFGNNPRLYARFNVRGLLRAEFLTQQQGLQIQRRNGVINANQWRALDDLNRIPEGENGEAYVIEANMQAMAQLGQKPPTPTVVPAVTPLRHVFRDAVARVCKWEKHDEAKVAAAFLPVLVAIDEASGGDGTMIGERSRALATAAPSWNSASAESIADAEFAKFTEG